jgi:hypothetical protein
MEMAFICIAQGTLIACTVPRFGIVSLTVVLSEPDRTA